MRVPFIAVSPLSKPHYVSHTVGDHTSLLALIERRFMGGTMHLTERDAHANTLEDLFDLDHSPSLNTAIDHSLAIPASPRIRAADHRGGLAWSPFGGIQP